MINSSPADLPLLLTESELFSALAHPARIQILKLLRNEEQCVCHLEAYTGYRQAYLSQQLKILRDAGLVVNRKEGWNNLYRVRDARVFDLLEKAAGMTQAEPDASLGQAADRGCQCPKCRDKSQTIHKEKA